MKVVVVEVTGDEVKLLYFLVSRGLLCFVPQWVITDACYDSMANAFHPNQWSIFHQVRADRFVYKHLQSHTLLLTVYIFHHQQCLGEVSK